MIFPVAKPDLSGNEMKYCIEAVRYGVISSRSPFVERFEDAFAKFIGTKYAVATNTGTSALQLSLMALGIGPGDEVIVPEFTMIASAWAVTYTGAKPVFVDCGDDLNIDVDKIVNAITPATKAIMPVHIYGRPCAMDKIMEIANKYGLFVVEDACEAHGATFQGKKVGSFGNTGCFSLFGNKIITSGEGGVITTNNEALVKELQYLRSMAFEKEHTFLHQKVGNNFRMSGLQAAVALAQVERIDEFLDKRRQIQKWYDEFLGDLTIERPKGSVVWMYDIVSDCRDRIMFDLGKSGIETRMFFKPMSMQPMYSAPYGHLNATAYANSGCYLPTYTSLSKDDVRYISNAVKRSLDKQIYGKK